MMIIRSLLVAAVAAVSFSAHATLAPLTSPTEWPPAGSSGLEPVLFNKATWGNEGEYVALGAHAYINSASLSNDTVSEFYADAGIYAGNPKAYANWSFDFSYNIGACTDCTVTLAINGSSSTGAFSGSLDLNTLRYPANLGGALIYGNAGQESWNMEMGFLTEMLGVNFDPYSISSTDFSLIAYNNQQDSLAETEINVEVQQAVNPPVNPPTNPVPEPGTLALVGLGLAGIGMARRRMMKN